MRGLIIARDWLNIAEGGDFKRNDPYFRFIAVWVAFNALCSTAIATRGDEDKVRK
jgi:hypothetical protein